MEIIEIIKNGYDFTKNNLDNLAIYVVLSVIVGVLLFAGIILTGISYKYGSYLTVLGVILLILGLILSFIVLGYQLNIIKSGIDLTEKAPIFDWRKDLTNGIKLFIVYLIYTLIPSVIVLIVGLMSNVHGNVINLVKEANMTYVNPTHITTGISMNAISQSTLEAFYTSIGITAIVAVVLFVIFAFISPMGQARLANTCSLSEALNIFEAAKDPLRIGIGKFLAVMILIGIIFAVIESILGYINGLMTPLMILIIIVTPCLNFFAQRVLGVLYSEIT